MGDYEEKLSSKVADADNAAGGAGAITAALFLQHFAGDVPWAHLDIASVGDSPGRALRVDRGAQRLRAARAAGVALLRRPAGGRAVRGLTVRWSLADASDDVLETLAAYVADTSHARFTGMPGLAYKTWRAVPGQWFEGCYVFVDEVARAAFQEQFTAVAAESPGSQIVGSAPVLIEPCEVVAVAEGGAGFAPSARG